MDKVIDFRCLTINPNNCGMGHAPEIGDVEYIAEPSVYGSGLANGTTYNTYFSVEKCYGRGKPQMLENYEYDDKPF